MRSEVHGRHSGRAWILQNRYNLRAILSPRPRRRCKRRCRLRSRSKSAVSWAPNWALGLPVVPMGRIRGAKVSTVYRRRPVQLSGCGMGMTLAVITATAREWSWAARRRRTVITVARE
ncbi:meiosis specific protein Hop1 [Histoplasma capsulatum var. duboisii H88]|uniref:Meiosis specific protein Hop1 n=1 Tax=Ajellomyces capsulatus (strain H88) TaxID=544711 RepID=A0A8A1LH25_AJEC8|nr:meiosis specific protein Hop1 [Histoplasma capsulatum var. duboisii H88]